MEHYSGVLRDFMCNKLSEEKICPRQILPVEHDDWLPLSEHAFKRGAVFCEAVTYSGLFTPKPEAFAENCAEIFAEQISGRYQAAENAYCAIFVFPPSIEFNSRTLEWIIHISYEHALVFESDFSDEFSPLRQRVWNPVPRSGYESD